MSKKNTSFGVVIRVLLVAAVTGLMSAAAFALPEVPDGTGWSGDVAFGAGGLNIDSNTVAGNNFIDLNTQRLEPGDLSDTPDSRSRGLGVLTGEVRWNLGRRNQLFLGTSEERLVTLDGGTALGWRKGTDNAGTFEVAVVSNLAVPLEVYEDSFDTTGKRKKTDSERQGLRFTWDRIFGTAFEWTVQGREIDVDKDREGQSLLGVDTSGLGGTGVISTADLRRLERDADDVSTSIAYKFEYDGGHTLRPLLAFKNRDADGDAQSFDEIRAQLTYAFRGQKASFVSNLSYGQRDFDKRNPIYDDFRDSDTIIVDVTYLRKLSMGDGESWRWFLNFAWAEESSDIDFYDQEILRGVAGVEYSF